MNLVWSSVMRLPYALNHLFHFHAPAEPAPAQRRASWEVPLAEVEDSVPTMGIWNGFLMLLAIGFSHNRLSARQRQGGRAKRSMPRYHV